LYRHGEIARIPVIVNWPEVIIRVIVRISVVVVLGIPIIRVAKPEESEIGEETVAVEKTVVAIETATTEAATVIMPKSEVVAAAPGVKQTTESGFAMKMRLRS
jgi:hypothetical protein